jgi:PAS domain S-box-containing protein
MSKPTRRDEKRKARKQPNRGTKQADGSTSEFQRLLESVPDTMVIINREGVIVNVNGNAEKLFGYDRNELLEKQMEVLVPARFRQRHSADRQTFSKHPRVRPMDSGLELYALRKDGTEFPVEISLSSVTFDAGTFFMSAIRDITERKLQEELPRKSLEEASRLKSEFLANMSHELRTPLNGIIDFAKLMHDGRLGPVSDNHKEYLGDILTSAKHLLQLINDVPDLAKIEAGKMEFQPEALELQKLVRETCDIRGTDFAIFEP